MCSCRVLDPYDCYNNRHPLPACDIMGQDEADERHACGVKCECDCHYEPDEKGEDDYREVGTFA